MASMGSSESSSAPFHRKLVAWLKIHRRKALLLSKKATHDSQEIKIHQLKSSQTSIYEEKVVITEPTPKFIPAETLQDSSVLSMGRSFRLSRPPSMEIMASPSSPVELINIVPEHVQRVVPATDKKAFSGGLDESTPPSILPLFGFDRESIRQAFDNNPFQPPT
jgi:hypothetical protein